MDSVDITVPGVASLIAEKVREGIDAKTMEANPPKYSWRVKPSDLANDCVAALWYAFRWAKLPTYDARTARLFQRGHKAEAGLVGYLRADGWEVREYEKRLCYDANSDTYIAVEWDAEIPAPFVDVHLDDAHIIRAKRRDEWLLRQYRVKDFGGHLSGYLDGIARHPLLSAGKWVMLEFKTYATGRFTKLIEKTVRINDPKYYGQIVLYLKYRSELAWCLFLAVCKNDDNLHVEIIGRDEGRSNDLLKIADTVVNSKARPARVAESAAYWKCKSCEFVGVCHHGQAPDISCRSCIYATAIDEGKFKCDKWAATIPGEKEIRAACPAYSPIF